MSDISELQQKICEFRDERNWKQFHNPKDMTISLALEAAELLEHFQWKSSQEIEVYIHANKKEISHEIIDVLYWVLLIANDLDIDIKKAFDEKMMQNREKYPESKSKNKHTKYSKL
jgi:NTP pyrophosphatase (non-canonical NTP hydrolase)